MMTETEIQQIQGRVDRADEIFAQADRRRLLEEVRRLCGENKQFRSSVRQYAEHHAMLVKEAAE